MVRCPTTAPYPDEELGSVVIRMRRHVGLTPRRFMHWYFGHPNFATLKSFGNLLQPMAELTGLAQATLLWEHTLIPYGLASLSPEASKRQLSEHYGRSPLQHSDVIGKFSRRWCETCFKLDLQTFGEPYWHRSHMLPGVSTCYVHGSPLIHEPSRPRYLTSHHATAFWIEDSLPGESGGTARLFPISVRLQHKITSLSAGTLRWRRKLPSVSVTADGLQKTFGSELLREAGCFREGHDKFPLTTLRILSLIAQDETSVAGSGQSEFKF